MIELGNGGDRVGGVHQFVDDRQWYDGTRFVDLLAWTSSTVVNAGQAENRIDLQARGSDFTFNVNGTTVAQITDDTLSSGAVGVFTGGDGNQVLLERFVVAGP